MSNNSDISEQYAFPKPDCDQLYAQTGMTLRDYFAAAALNAIDLRDLTTSGQALEAAVAITAYRIADAMLAARKESP